MCDRINALFEAPRAGPKIWAGQLWDPTWFSQFGQIGCGELLSLHRPDVVRNALGALMQAGADGVSTNTFGAIPSVIIEHGVSPGIAKESALEVNVQLARKTRQVAQPGECAVARGRRYLARVRCTGETRVCKSYRESRSRCTPGFT